MMKTSFYSIDDKDEWDSIVNHLAQNISITAIITIFLFLGHEQGHPYLVHGQSSNGEVIYAFFKREIQIPKLDMPYYDIISAYGYGGALYFPINSYNLTDLAAEFDQSFVVFCQNEKIVSEFIRIDPTSGNYPKIESHFYLSVR